MKPRPLALEFSRNGHVLTQMKRNDHAAIYSVDGRAFEVVRITTAKEVELPNGKTAPFREIYPNDEDFGRTGWYFMPEQAAAAQSKFEELSHGAPVQSH